MCTVFNGGWLTFVRSLSTLQKVCIVNSVEFARGQKRTVLSTRNSQVTRDPFALRGLFFKIYVAFCPKPLQGPLPRQGSDFFRKIRCKFAVNS